MGNPYETGLERNPANYAPLTPLLFIEWSAYVYPDRPAVIHGSRRFTWAETYARARRLASAGRRMAGHLAELHVGDDRGPERCRLSPPRRLSQRHRQHSPVEHAAPLGVPLDTADVPLQRMVLSMDDGGKRRDQRMPQACRSGPSLPGDQGTRRHALLRRSDRAQHARKRA